MSSAERGFSIEQSADTLVFRTRNFEADRGSVLHSDIYSPELSSMLASFGLASAVSLLLYVTGNMSGFAYLLIGAVLICSFPLLRRFVFRDSFLETVFSKAAGTVEVFACGTRRKKKPLRGLLILKMSLSRRSAYPSTIPTR